MAFLTYFYLRNFLEAYFILLLYTSTLVRLLLETQWNVGLIDFSLADLVIKERTKQMSPGTLDQESADALRTELIKVQVSQKHSSQLDSKEGKTDGSSRRSVSSWASIRWWGGGGTGCKNQQTWQKNCFTPVEPCVSPRGLQLHPT